jgi:hypothetical protein
MLFWLVNPYQTQDRFLFAAFGLLAAPVALQFERLPWLGAPFVALFAWHLVAGTPMLVDWIQAATSYNFREYLWPPLLPPPLQVIAASWSATISNRIILGRLILGAAALMAGVLLALSSRVNHNRRWCTTIALALIAAGISIRAYCAWIPSNLARFRFIPLAPQIGYTPGWLVVESLSDQPKRVAYAGTNLPFYLLGSRLQNRVQYVNINRHTAFRMHDYHRLYDRPLSDSPTPDWDRREADEVAWLGNLREQRIDLLFVGFVNRIGGMHNVHDQDGFPLERTWADRNPAIFQPIHVDSRTRVYTVRFDNQSD